MMKIGIIDIIYIILIFQLFVFCIFLFAKKNKSLSNYILGIQLISQAVGVFASLCYNQSEYFNHISPNLKFIGYPFMVLWGPTFYIYVKLTAYKDFKIKKFDLVHFIPFIIYLSLFLGTFLPSGLISVNTSFSSGFPILFNFYLNVFVRFQVLFYIILSIRTLYSVSEKLKENFSSTTFTNLSWIKFLIYGFTICFILTIPIIIFRYVSNTSTPLSELGIVIPYFTYFNIIFFKAWYHPEIFAGVEENIKYKSSKLTKEEAGNLTNELNKYVEFHKPYLNPDLTLNQLAEDLNVNPRILSQVINEYFNQNFYDYINKLRVEESKKMLLDTSDKKTVSEILYAVGFNSKSAYNIAFKRATGITPTEFRKKTDKEFTT